MRSNEESSLGHFRDQPGHDFSRNQRLRKNTELVERTGSRQPAAICQGAQSLAHDVFGTLHNSRPLPSRRLRRVAVLALDEASGADRHHRDARAAQFLLERQ